MDRNQEQEHRPVTEGDGETAAVAGVGARRVRAGIKLQVPSGIDDRNGHAYIRRLPDRKCGRRDRGRDQDGTARALPSARLD